MPDDANGFNLSSTQASTLSVILGKVFVDEGSDQGTESQLGFDKNLDQSAILIRTRVPLPTGKINSNEAFCNSVEDAMNAELMMKKAAIYHKQN